MYFFCSIIVSLRSLVLSGYEIQFRERRGKRRDQPAQFGNVFDILSLPQSKVAHIEIAFRLIANCTLDLFTHTIESGADSTKRQRGCTRGGQNFRVQNSLSDKVVIIEQRKYAYCW